ncbi:MAG: dienelactone hydrolase family protein [Pseudomonas sp.]|nr:dienelactone hydrolase family protein [Pseudomonas sp.]
MSVLYECAPESFCTLIFAHGAGAPMDSPFMETMTQHLLALNVSVVRFEFSYMAQRRIDGVRRPPNKPNVLLDAWRSVFDQVRAQTAEPIVLAGKSMGGRMASMLADELQADALVCLGYPFYPAKKQDKPRTAHLADLQAPTLIVQGERDALGCKDVVLTYDLSLMIQFEWMELADHDLKPLKRSGFTHEQYLQRAGLRIVEFLKAHLN